MITIVEHNPDWASQFEQEAKVLKSTLGAAIVNLHHIGSTSVPGLLAKPIIDMLLEATDLQSLDSKTTEMEAIGYEVMGEFGIPGRRYFKKGGESRTHHVHSFVSGDANLTRHLAFKEYLIHHKDIADAYGLLKAKIVKTCNDDMGQYCDAKDPFIKLHEPKAVKWFSEAYVIPTK